jgi:hypothetical protein
VYPRSGFRLSVHYMTWLNGHQIILYLVGKCWSESVVVEFVCDRTITFKYEWNTQIVCYKPSSLMHYIAYYTVKIELSYLAAQYLFASRHLATVLTSYRWEVNV